MIIVYRMKFGKTGVPARVIVTKNVQKSSGSSGPGVGEELWFRSCRGLGIVGV